MNKLEATLNEVELQRPMMKSKRLANPSFH